MLREIPSGYSDFRHSKLHIAKGGENLNSNRNFYGALSRLENQNAA